MSAENGTLQVQRNLIDSGDLAAQLVGQLEGQEIAQGRKPASPHFRSLSRSSATNSLVKRILVNMLKNRAGGIPEGAEVTMGSARFRTARPFQCTPTFIEPSIQKQIFHRYFSTKGGDRGLGTWGMRLLAEDYLGGSVSFVIHEGRGHHVLSYATVETPRPF